MEPLDQQYAIEMLHITKRFPGIIANDDITLQLKKGEIHALLGENGAGKSTLMSILFGLYQPTSGIIKKNGQEVHINTPNDANDLNIGMVHQHFKLIDVFTGMGFDVVFQGLIVSVLVMISYVLGHYIESGVFEFVNSPDGTTMAFLTMSMAEICHSFNMRSQRGSLFSIRA